MLPVAAACCWLLAARWLLLLRACTGMLLQQQLLLLRACVRAWMPS
jgi:hypothetical protein